MQSLSKQAPRLRCIPRTTQRMQACSVSDCRWTWGALCHQAAAMASQGALPQQLQMQQCSQTTVHSMALLLCLHSAWLV